MPERVKKTKCGGVVAKQILGEGEYAGESKEYKMQGVGVLRKKIEWGGYAGEDKEDKMRGEGVAKKN